MSPRFTGWPERAFEVLLQLDGDPPASVRERWRAEREGLVRRPMVDLCQDLADLDPAYEDFHVWHLHKDPWLWQHQYASFRLARRVGLGVRFDLDGLVVEGGWPRADPGQVERFRAAVRAEASGAALAEIVAVFEANGFTLTGDRMARPPRGWPVDHPRPELARHRTLMAVRPLGCDSWLHSSKPLDRVHEAFQQLRPLMSWLEEHLDPHRQ